MKVSKNLCLTENEKELLALTIESELSEEDKIKDIFKNLNDPLLSLDDIEGFFSSSKKLNILKILEKLEQQDFLESDDKTQRIFDKDIPKLYRLKNKQKHNLELFGIQYKSSKKIDKFLFSCDGRIVRNFSKISRLDALLGEGQQREEISKHIEDISKGIQEGSEIPNAILLVLNEDLVSLQDENDDSNSDDVPDFFVKVTPRTDWIENAHPDVQNEKVQDIRPVAIEIPYRKASFDSEKVFTVVDGQQRTSALGITPSDVIPTHIVPVVAIIADENLAREIFKIANSTVKISTDFSRALSAESNSFDDKDKIARICKRLALIDKDSPFYERVKYPNVKTKPARPIVYNSLYAVTSSIYNCTFFKTSSEDQIVEFIKLIFNKVKDIWKVAWLLKPANSKLVHGAGLKSMASLIVFIVESERPSSIPVDDHSLLNKIFDSLNLLKPLLIWSTKEYEKASKPLQDTYRDKIDDVQNTAKDISKLSEDLKSMFLMAERQANKKP